MKTFIEMKYIKYTLITLFLILSFSKRSSAQWSIMRSDADSLIRLGSDYIYNVKFDSASACFHQVIQKYPNNPAGYFLDAMVEWWKIRLFRETTNYDNVFLKKIDKVIDICEIRLDSNQADITALFFIGGAYGYRGRFYAIRKSYINVANDGRRGYNALTECWKLAPGNHDIQLGTGLYNYFVIAFVEKYPILKPLTAFFPNGDKKIGILQLKSAAKYARYDAIEAEDVLLQIYYQFEENYSEALKIAEKLNFRFPDNPYFHRYLARCYIIKGYSYRNKAESSWREIIKRCIRKKTGYDRLTAREALYYVGYLLMLKGNNKTALKYFYKCDEASRYVDKDGPSGFMVKTNLHIAKIYLKLGKKKYAIKQYRKILNMKDYDGSHKIAERKIKQLAVSN